MPNPRPGGLFGRAGAQPSVVVVEGVDLIGEERSLRDRVPQSLPGPRSPRSRSSVDTRSRSDRWQEGTYPSLWEALAR